jgi:divalent metal cation (Fe/Co/Zn/Cd) transporter
MRASVEARIFCGTRARIVRQLVAARLRIGVNIVVPERKMLMNPTLSIDRRALVAQAFRLEWATIGWMTVEAVVAIAAGIAAGSLSLLAFGLDSAVELISACVLIWRLSVELRLGQEFSENAERLASRIGGCLLFVLAAYVVASAAWSLWSGHGERFSVAGLAVTTAAVPVMYVLAKRKLKVAEAIGSRALRADAVESITCGYLAIVVLIGLIAESLTGFWWVDAVTSLAIVWFLVKEGHEAWVGEECREHGH